MYIKAAIGLFAPALLIAQTTPFDMSVKCSGYLQENGYVLADVDDLADAEPEDRRMIDRANQLFPGIQSASLNGGDMKECVFKSGDSPHSVSRYGYWDCNGIKISADRFRAFDDAGEDHPWDVYGREETEYECKNIEGNYWAWIKKSVFANGVLGNTIKMIQYDYKLYKVHKPTFGSSM